MSATNRGAIRRSRDSYYTPIPTIQAILTQIRWDRVETALEPCKGDGRIIQLAKKAGPDTEWDWCEISDQQSPRDYLRQEFEPRQFDLILTNPPYSLAQQFITKALHDAVCVVMLLRLNFLGAQKRFHWWQSRTPTHLRPLSVRPDFTGGGGDATDYAWFCWDQMNNKIYGPPISVLYGG